MRKSLTPIFSKRPPKSKGEGTRDEHLRTVTKTVLSLFLLDGIVSLTRANVPLQDDHVIAAQNIVL